MLIIGIAGGTGSGKTTVVNKIVKELPVGEVTVISQDSYYNDTGDLPYEQRTKINFDHPSSIDFDLLTENIAKLKNGEIVEQPIYSFVTHNRTSDKVLTHPKKVLIVEGILIFNHKPLMDLLDMKIFVHADADERLIRRVYRDIKERGRDIEEVLSRYQNTLKPMHMQFIEPTKNLADIIIPHDRYNDVAIDILKTVISNRLD